MMNLELIRYSFGEITTLGVLYDITGGRRDFLCFTLEDRARPDGEKVDGETCIAADTYEITLRTEGGYHEAYSKPGHWSGGIHRGMLWLQGVENFKWIYLHPGNIAKHTKGCILVADGVTQNVSEEGSLQSSRSAYRRIYPPIADARLRGERVVLQIREVW